MKRKTFIIVGPYGSGKWKTKEKIQQRRKKECYTLDKIDTIHNLKQLIEEQIRADRDIYIIETRIERIPNEILKIADKIIKKE